jgi:hypothetical protein
MYFYQAETLITNKRGHRGYAAASFVGKGWH